MVGFPSVGKSTLLTKLTGINISMIILIEIMKYEILLIKEIYFNILKVHLVKLLLMNLLH